MRTNLASALVFTFVHAGCGRSSAPGPNSGDGGRRPPATFIATPDVPVIPAPLPATASPPRTHEHRSITALRQALAARLSQGDYAAVEAVDTANSDRASQHVIEQIAADRAVRDFVGRAFRASGDTSAATALSALPAVDSRPHCGSARDAITSLAGIALTRNRTGLATDAPPATRAAAASAGAAGNACATVFNMPHEDAAGTCSDPSVHARDACASASTASPAMTYVAAAISFAFEAASDSAAERSAIGERAAALMRDLVARGRQR